jgi:hypothetical protein
VVPRRAGVEREDLDVGALARIAMEQGDQDTARALAAQADRRMESASHFITDRDRIDAHQSL